MDKNKRDIALDAAFILIVLGGFVAVTWGRWAHPIIDYGREVYVPWRITAGEVLYKDLAYLFGAFPPYWNALLFKVFGPSIATLTGFNTALALADVFLVYRFLYLSADRLTALLGAAGFLLLAVCNLHMAYNMYYLAPYSHNAAYAVFFVLCALNVLPSLLRILERRAFFLLGFFLAGALLSRLEIFLAAALAIFTALGLYLRKYSVQKNKALPYIGTAVAGIFFPVIVFWVYFAAHLPPLEALFAVIGYNPQWREVAQTTLYAKQYAAWQGNVILMAMALGGSVLLITGIEICCRGLMLWQRGKERLKALLICGLSLLIYAGVLYVCTGENAYDVFRGQIILQIILVVFCYKRFQSSAGLEDNIRTLCLWALCAWGLFMLGKIPLKCVVRGSGLIYGVPAMLTAIVLFVYLLPQRVQRLYGQGRIAAIAAALLLTLLFCRVFASSLNNLSLRLKTVGQGANALRTIDYPLPFGLGTDIEKFLTWSRDHLRDNDTYVVLPEGVMLNFLTRHQITGQHITFMPAELATFTEERMLAGLKDVPPDYVVIVNKDNTAYGNMVFGKNYAPHLYQWVMTRYSPVWDSRVMPSRYTGITVFKRQESQRHE